MTTPNHLSDDQRKHLDFIQAIITRMSSSSSSVKGGGVTVSMAAFGFSANEANPFIACLGLIAVLLFATLDAHYLRQERLFRALYDDARQGLVETYSMAKDSYEDGTKISGALKSWSVAGFYGPLLAIGGAALWWAIYA